MRGSVMRISGEKALRQIGAGIYHLSQGWGREQADKCIKTEMAYREHA